MNSSRYLCLPLALVASLATGAGAQECVGLPSQSRGTFTAGLEGTDGSVGEGLKFVRRGGGWSVELGYRTLHKISRQDPLETFGVQAALRLPGPIRRVCLTLAPELTRYSTEMAQRAGVSYWPQDTAGNYQRVGVPLGIAIGREFTVAKWLSLVPFYNPHVIAEFERFEADTGQYPRVPTRQASVSYRSSVGMTLASSWFVVRSVLTTPHLTSSRLVRESEFPTISLQVGVRY